MNKKTTNGREKDRTLIVSEEIRGLITDPESKDQIPFLIWDVSLFGIGVWTSLPLTPGKQIILTVGQPFLLVVKPHVVWCEKQQGDHLRGYRCGLGLQASDKVVGSLIHAFQRTLPASS